MNQKKICAVLIALMLVICTLSISVFASEGDSVLNVLVPDNSETVADEDLPKSVSPALDVLAKKCGMSIAGVKGNALNFSADRFACAMNLAEIEYITITSLPDALCGALYLGSEGVSVGQKVKAKELSLMTYEETQEGIGKKASFDFRIEDSSYELTCSIFMIAELNYSPTVSLASQASLNIETYRDIRTCGLLSAYDPEGDRITFEVVQYPKNGRLVLENATVGTYSYIPNDGYTGEDSFKYVACDQYGNYSAWNQVNLYISVPSSATVYRDLMDDAAHNHAIAMTECGIMNGVQIGNHYYFEAEREVTRAEFLVTAMNALGIKNLPDADHTIFADDEQINPEMKNYVALAYEKGYISGKVRDGKPYFVPDEKIKLSEAAVIISNMIGYAEPQIKPIFADTVPSWSEKAIHSVYTLGILETPEMISGAQKTLTRGDMAKLLNKMMYVIGK